MVDASGTAVQQAAMDAQTTVLGLQLGVPAVLGVTVVAGTAETPVLPVPVVAGDALVALAVQVDAGQPATAGAHNHAHQAAATQLELGAYLDK